MPLIGEFRHAALFNVQGIVTKVNMPLLYFEINDDKRIYVEISTNLPTFPVEGDLVELSKLIINTPKTGVMGPETLCKFPTSNVQTGQLFWTIRKNKCNPKEIFVMDKIIRKLSTQLPEEVLVSCLVQLLSQPENQKSFRKLVVKVPEDLVHVQGSPELDDLPIGTCKFSVYPSQSLEIPCSRPEFLFGVLDVHPNYGCFCLNSKLFVKYLYTDDLYKFKNSVVMIKKWTSFTEVFKPNTAVCVLNYILLDFKDVVIVRKLKEPKGWKRCFYSSKESYQPESVDIVSQYFQVKRISEVIVGYENAPECWIEGLLSMNGSPTCNPRKGVHFRCTNLSVVPFLREGTVYKLYSKQQPTRDFHCPELYGLRDNQETFRMVDNTVFTETGEHTPSSVIALTTFSDAKEAINQVAPNCFITIELKISRKGVQDSTQYSSRHKKRFLGTVPYYGNPDDEHQFRIYYYDIETRQYLDLYFTNRDNNITPLGLLEDMVVRISNVQPVKRKYLKTTVYTSYQIVEYAPQTRFTSVELTSDLTASNKWLTIPTTPLGLYYSIPAVGIFKGSFILKLVYDLVITPICFGCQTRVLADRPCGSCHSVARDLNVHMTVSVQDARNPCFNVDAGTSFLCSLLGIRDHKEASLFYNAFYKCDTMVINFVKAAEFDATACTQDPDTQFFLKQLMKTIHIFINNRMFPWIDAVCERKEGHTPWQLKEFKTF